MKVGQNLIKEDVIFDLTKEKQATPQVAFVFLGPLTKDPPA